MPTLDDTPIVPTLIGGTDLTAGVSSDASHVARADILQVYDVSTQQPKTITVQELGEALGLIFA